MLTVSAPSSLPRWDAIDTVLLDMDGTLLDLSFDNYFWLELVPSRFAQRHGLAEDVARVQLAPRFAACRGTLQWYCTDYWSRELELDIAGLKHEVRERVRFLPGAEQFLSRLRELQLRTVLVTNAHQDSLSVKAAQIDLGRYFDRMLSSHQFQIPKEHAPFWPQLQAELRFDPARTLFVDDSHAVLLAARAYGIGQVFAVSRPDSTQGAHEVVDFPAVPAVVDLLASLPAIGHPS